MESDKSQQREFSNMYVKVHICTQKSIDFLQKMVYTYNNYWWKAGVRQVNGKKQWYIVDGYRPSPQPDPKADYVGHESVMILDSMEKYYNFKTHDYPEGTIFQIDIKTPRNLKPSLIR